MYTKLRFLGLKNGVFLSAPSFFWTFISLCLGDCPLQAGWWQHSTMIERPETAVPSIAVSPFVFEIWYTNVQLLTVRVCSIGHDLKYTLNTLFNRVPLLLVPTLSYCVMERPVHQAPMEISPFKDFLDTYKKRYLDKKLTHTILQIDKVSWQLRRSV